MSDTYQLALYDMKYKINGKTYLVLILATSFYWALTHVNFKDKEGITDARCFICPKFSNLATLSSQHSVTLRSLLELDDTVSKLKRRD